VYILTVDGRWLCRPFVVRNKRQTIVNAGRVKMVLHELSQHKLVGGVVQVSTGWSIKGLKPTDVVANPIKYKARKEILLFNGHGTDGAKVRVYELSRKGRLKLASRLIGTFPSKPNKIEEDI
jgi:hypothetical protein